MLYGGNKHTYNLTLEVINCVHRAKITQQILSIILAEHCLQNSAYLRHFPNLRKHLRNLFIIEPTNVVKLFRVLHVNG